MTSGLASIWEGLPSRGRKRSGAKLRKRNKGRKPPVVERSPSEEWFGKK